MFSTKTIQMLLSAKTIASAAATVMFILSIARSYLPSELRNFIFLKLRSLIARFSTEFTLVIDEYDGLNQNKLFHASNVYLEPKIPPYVNRVRVTVLNKENEKNISVSMEKNDEIFDIFNGVHLKWKFVSKSNQAATKNSNPDSAHFDPVAMSASRFFELRFHKKHKETVVGTYLPHVLEKSKEMTKQKKSLKLFTLRYESPFDDYEVMSRNNRVWQSVNLDHPATFDTLAMDLDVKKMIMSDLDRFLKRRDFYKRVGKAWKRGYLLYGPPGTGKSSLIAAMANYLKFDIHDLQLTTIRNNSQLRRLLIATENRSILVVEDIDCTLELRDKLVESRAVNAKRYGHGSNQGAEYQVTLSGLLNFIDGLWSSCGDERIIVFTTNHKDRLDPALLRPGRMDVHIHMSYCTPCGFKMLASNYLSITEHSLFFEIDELIEKAKVTPAEVGELLMKDEVPEIALQGLIEFMMNKIESESKGRLEAAKAMQNVEEKVDGHEKQEGNKNLDTLEKLNYNLMHCLEFDACK